MPGRLRVLLLSWEYPPTVVGGLGRHVHALATQLAAGGHEVRVVTLGRSATVTTEVVDAVTVVRAARDPLAIDFAVETLLAWSQAAEHALTRAALSTVRDWRPDLVHAHDWLVAQTAITTSGVTGAPVIATVHATETGRHRGYLPEPLHRGVHSVERWLATTAERVIVCSPTMRTDVITMLDVDPALVSVVPNGVDVDFWGGLRRRPDPAPTLLCAGRLVHEKGVQTVVDALPRLRRGHGDVRLTIAGTGGHQPELQALARRRRLAGAIEWAGFLDESRLRSRYAAAWVSVVPSLYEPFGLAALEALAARCPVVAADTGGLHDLAERGLVTSFRPGDPDDLARAVDGVLSEPVAAARRARRAAGIVRRGFRWQHVAEATVEVYRDALARAGRRNDA